MFSTACRWRAGWKTVFLGSQNSSPLPFAPNGFYASNRRDPGLPNLLGPEGIGRRSAAPSISRRCPASRRIAQNFLPRGNHLLPVRRSLKSERDRTESEPHLSPTRHQIRHGKHRFGRHRPPAGHLRKFCRRFEQGAWNQSLAIGLTPTTGPVRAPGGRLFKQIG